MVIRRRPPEVLVADADVLAATTTEAAPAPAANDYGALFISADDIDAPEPFIAGGPMANRDGMAGIATIFHNESNTAMIGDTIVVLADPAAAAAVLNKTAETLPTTTVMGNAVPWPIGSGQYGDRDEGR